MATPIGSDSDINVLLHKVRHCTLCEDKLPHGTRPVLQIHPSASIVIAGQAPGRKVHASGIPFDDASGDRLREWLGLDKTTFYDASNVAILPMGFCYPGTGKSGDLPPRPECAPAWRQALLSHLDNVLLTLVIGQYAHAAYYGADGQNLTQRVKNWQQYWPDTIPLPHPSPRNNIWLKRNPWFQAELLPVLQQRILQLIA